MPYNNGSTANDGQGIEFFSDNTVVQKIKLGRRPVPYKGTWVILDDGRVKIDINIFFGTMTLIGDIEDGVLVLVSKETNLKLKYKK